MIHKVSLFILATSIIAKEDNITIISIDGKVGEGNGKERKDGQGLI